MSQCTRNMKANGRCPNEAEPGRKMCSSCLAYYRMRNVLQGDRVRRKVYEGYGGKCSRCGLDDLDCLELHHVDHDGGEREDRKSGNQYFYRLIREGFPIYLELLCANCHRKHHRTFMLRQLGIER